MIVYLYININVCYSFKGFRRPELRAVMRTFQSLILKKLSLIPIDKCYRHYRVLQSADRGCDTQLKRHKINMWTCSFN